MRTCGFCKWLKNGLCDKGYDIIPLEKIKGYKRPKQCTKKQESATKKKRNSDAYLNKQLDAFWSKSIRQKGYCELCGKRPPEVVLHAHHIFSRRHFSTRWDVRNGVCLCTGCHLYKAHKDIQEFADWVLVHFGLDYIEELRKKAHKEANFSKDDKIEMMEELKKDLTLK